MDKWLVYARFAKHRSTATELISAGQVRLNAKRMLKPSHNVKSGDVLTLVLSSGPRIIKVLDEAERRGPAKDAQLLYQDLNLDNNMGLEHRASKLQTCERKDATIIIT